MKEYTLKELEQGLSDGIWTSLDLVKMYLDRIYTYDLSGKMINSVSEINPDVYQIASMLDHERNTIGARSKIHGIPILIKDNILTKDKMHTRASSKVLEDYYGTEDAFIVKKLRDAGAIILGKTNLSEFAYFMSFENMPSGFGSLHGQVKSPYSEDIDPLGSSTGSAVSVACNFIPVSIGTETNGSLTAPALMNSIQTLKPSMGLISRTGIIPISHHQDTAGPMARTVEDLAILMEYIYGYDIDDVATGIFGKQTIDFLGATSLSVKGKRIAFVKYSNMSYSQEEEIIEEEAKAIFRKHGIETVDLKLEIERISNHLTMIYDFKVNLNHFMNKYMQNYKVKSLEEIIDFNLQDKEERMPYGQSIFDAASKTSGSLREKEYHDLLKSNLEKARLLTRELEANKLDAIVSIKRTSHAPIAGNPCVAVVAKALKDTSPKSLFITGKMYSDDLLLKIAHIYEQETKKRIAPNLEKLYK